MEEKMSYKAKGYVRRNDNNRGLAGLRVKAYDVDWLSADDYLGSDVTDSNGYFEITFKKEDFDAGWYDPEGGPDLVVKVFNPSNHLVYKTREHSAANTVTIFNIKLNPLDLLGEYTVQGRVNDQRTGRHLCNLQVKAYDEDYIIDDFLGEDITNHSGDFLINYENSDFSGVENFPDPYLQIYNQEGRRLARSDTDWDAPRHTRVNLLLPAQEIKKIVFECVYGWVARYRQEGTHIVVRIKLVPDRDVSEVKLNELRNTWKNGIEERWSNRFASKCPFCNNQAPLTFEVQWVTRNEHHKVRVHRGASRSNMTNWDTEDTASVAAHEFGHMLGLVDEYPDSACPDRSPVDTETIMDNNSDVVERQVEHLAALLNENAVPIAAAPEKNAKKHLGEMKKVLNMPDDKKGAMCRLPNLSARSKIKSSLKIISKKKKKPAGTDRITHIVTGGTCGKRIENRMVLSSDGSVSYSEKDELFNRDQQYVSKLGERTYLNLLAHLVSSGLLDLKEAGGPFLPDSTIGIIQLDIDGATTHYYYLVDRDARQDQDIVMKQSIAAVVNSMNRLIQRTKKRDVHLQKKIDAVLKPTKK